MFSHKYTLREMVAAVKIHATDNYGKGGWDYVIETMDDWDIAEVIQGAKNAKGAIWKMSVHIGPMARYRDEIRATAW